MILQTNIDPIEIKWLCRNPTHLKGERCSERDYYWRFAEEMNGMWHGPFPSSSGALEAALDEYRLEVVEGGDGAGS